MDKETWYKRPFFYILVVLYFLAGFSTPGWGPKWAAILYPEDHYFENVGAISLFIASGLCFYAFLRAIRNRGVIGLGWFKTLFYLGLALLFFFGAGEEISWGQRIFHIKEPAALGQENTQDELNIHNLAIFQNSRYLEADTIFTIFWMAFAVALPAVSLLSTRLRRFAEKWTPVPYPGLGALFLLNYLFAKVVKYAFAAGYSYQLITFSQAVQEVKESNYELMFAFLAFTLLLDLGVALASTSQAQSRLDEVTAIPEKAAAARRSK